MLFFFLFNSKHLSATNYQLLSTSLFQGEPGWAEEPQGRNYLSPTTHSWAPKRGRWNPGPRPCRDRTACREQACFSDQEGGRAAALVPSPWLCLPWTACLPPSPRGRLAKAPGVSWPALHSRQEASLSQRWQRSNTPPPPPTPQACGQGPARSKPGRHTGGANTRTGRGHSPPARWALGAQVPVSCCLPRRGRVPGAVGKGRGRGPLPSAPVCPGVAVQPCRLPVSWLYRVSRLMEAPLLACPYSWLLGDRRGVWPTFPP